MAGKSTVTGNPSHYSHYNPDQFKGRYMSKEIGTFDGYIKDYRGVEVGWIQRTDGDWFRYIVISYPYFGDINNKYSIILVNELFEKDKEIPQQYNKLGNGTVNQNTPLTRDEYLYYNLLGNLQKMKDYHPDPPYARDGGRRRTRSKSKSKSKSKSRKSKSKKSKSRSRKSRLRK